MTFNNGSGTTLNRVTGNTPSTILGRLLASGSVYLLNPEGILIGRGGSVHTGGDFLASTLSLSGTTLLSGPSLASVVNLGNISSLGGNIYLIGRSVENAGSLSAPNGTVGLAAGSQVLIGDSSSNGRILVEGPGGDIVDSGFIAAAQAELKSNGGNIYALAGNNGGQIQATGTATQNGHIWLIAEHGTAHVAERLYAVNANGTGGAIETSGAQVVTKGAQIKTGQGGSWLLDPADLTIDSTLAGTIETTLNGGTNVTEQTTSSGTGGSGDIIVAAPISWTGNSTLILDAYHGVTANAAISATGSSAGLTISTNNGGSGGSFTANAPITLASSGSLTINTATYNLITTKSGLQSLPAGGSYALDADLNVSGSFTPITTFSGNFQGLGHTISNLTVSGGPFVGLFGRLLGGSSVANLNMTGASVTLSSGYEAGILAGSGVGSIYNVQVAGSVTVSSGYTVGALVGYASGPIVASSSSATVTGGTNNIGGLVGSATSSGTITTSQATGSVTIQNSSTVYSVGGLVGSAQGAITDSYATGAVSTGPAADVGGLAGSATGGISSSYAAGAVSVGHGTNFVGGLAGHVAGMVASSYASGAVSAGTGSNAVGGLVGSNSGAISSSYATGAVSGTTHVGGFVGLEAGSAGSQNYWDTTTSGQTTDAGNATGLTTAQWLTLGPAATNASGWNFNTTWLTGYPYPVLRALPYIFTSFDGASRPYGGAAPSYIVFSSGTQTGANASSLVSGTLTPVDATTATSPVGSYNIGGSGQTAAGYQLTYLGTLSINAAPLSYTATAVSRTYGAANPAFTGTVTGLVNGDSLGSVTSGTASFTSTPTASSNAGSYAITGSGLTVTNSNYTLVEASGNATAFTINPAVLTYTATPASRTYGANNPSFTGSVSGFVNGDTLGSATTGSAAFTSPASAASNVGSYAINGGGLTANFGNYTFAQAAGNATALTIGPALLTYNATSASRTYGATNPTFTGSVSGFVNGDTLSSATSGSAAFTSSASAASNVGSYAINGAGLTANFGNYTFAQADANANALTINPAVLTYNATPVSRTYGAANPTLTGTVTGFVNGDTLASATSGTANFFTEMSSLAYVGSYLIAGVGLTANTSNYTFAQADGNATALTVTPAVLTYTAASAARTYGTNNPTFSGTVSGFVNSDTLSSATTGSAAFTSQASAASNVGSYAVDGSGLTANHGNYTFAQADGNATALTINPALLTYTAASASRIYGATNPNFTGTVAGFVNGDTLSSATSGSAAFTSPATAASNVGRYAVDGAGLTADHGNYTFAQAEGNATALTINPATLTYTATPARQSYGNANTIFSGTVSGFVNGETLASATTGTARFTSATTATSHAGSYAIDGAGLTADHGNYVFTQSPANATALTIAAASTTPTPTPTPTGGTTVLTFAIGNSAGVGNGKPVFRVAYTGPAISGVDIGSILTGLTFSVTPSPISGPGTYTISASGTAPHGFTLAIAPATLTIVDATPQSLPSQVQPFAVALPALLPVSLLQPANSAGIFQIEIANTGSSFWAGQAPLAQSLLFGGNTPATTYSAGVKHR